MTGIRLRDAWRGQLVEVLDDVKSENYYLVFEMMKLGPVMTVHEVRRRGARGEETQESMPELTRWPPQVQGADPLPLEVARDYFRQLFLAIEYLHYQAHPPLPPAPCSLPLGRAKARGCRARCRAWPTAT